MVNSEDRKLPPDRGLNGGDVFRRSSTIAERANVDLITKYSPLVCNPIPVQTQLCCDGFIVGFI